MATKKITYVGSQEGFEESCRVLEGLAEVIWAKADKDEVSKSLSESVAFLDASMKTEITDEMIANSPDLIAISTATTGSDHIHKKVLSDRKIPLMTLRDDRELLLNITPAAEQSWALLMACARTLPAAINHVREGQWVREDFPGIMLNGKRLGVVGCGRIGTWMSRYATAFGMDVIGYDPYLDSWPETINQASLEEVMSSSDFISLHVHLSPETEGMISRKLLETVKPGAVLINTARGGILDEDALLDGLKSGQIAGVGLDVLRGEPDIANHPLVKYSQEHKNVLITPHCGGFSPDAVRVVCTRAAEKVAELLRNQG